MVLGVTVVLTSLLFPAFRGVRESAQRLSCASNMRQVGAAFVLYGTDHDDRLPSSRFGAAGDLLSPQEMMAANIGPGAQNLQQLGGDSDGIGWLVSSIGGRYLDSCSCLYCASHHGDHPYERYKDLFDAPNGSRIYTNYHYAGDRVLGSDDTAVVKMTNEHDQVLLTDGLRTKRDFNHGVGANILYGDCAVIWFSDAGGAILQAIPDSAIAPDAQVSVYNLLWDSIRKAGDAELVD